MCNKKWPYCRPGNRNFQNTHFYFQNHGVRNVSFSTIWLKIRDHSFSRYAKFSKKLAFLTPWYADVRVYQGVRNVSFPGNFAYVLNRWSLISQITFNKYFCSTSALSPPSCYWMKSTGQQLSCTPEWLTNYSSQVTHLKQH